MYISVYIEMKQPPYRINKYITKYIKLLYTPILDIQYIKSNSLVFQNNVYLHRRRYAWNKMPMGWVYLKSMWGPLQFR